MAANTPKTMSSRLAGMKFMQRSSASKAAPKTPQPSTPGEPPSKRIRLSNGHSAAAAPATPSTPRTPLDPEALRAEEALRILAEERGETKWVLSVQEPSTGAEEGMRIAYAGFAAMDADSEESGEEQGRPVRMSFGGGVRRKKAVAQTQTTAHTGGASDSEADSDEDSEESDESEYDSDDPTAALIRETKRDVYAQEREARRGQKSLQQAKAQLAQEKRRSTVHEDDSLAGLTSLSGGRGPGSVECFGCGQKGHIRSACPNASRSRGGAGGGGRGFGGRGGRGGRR